MTMYQPLTTEKFNEIYTSEEFRNQVATAHQCCDKNGKFMFFGTCSYPERWKVTEEQIELAKAEWDRAKAATIHDNKGKLLFTGMGSTYTPRYEDDVCNNRVRTEFTNKDGHRYFIEFGRGNGESTRVDHAIDRDLENLHDTKQREAFKKMESVRRYSPEWDIAHAEYTKWGGQPYHNFKGLERIPSHGQYTKANLLKIVNEYFDCCFTEIVIDNYNVIPDEYVSQSPKSFTVNQ